MRQFRVHMVNRVSRVRFSPDARTLTVAIHRHPDLVHLDMLSGPSQVWEVELEQPPSFLAYSADGATLAVGSPNGAVHPFLISAETLASEAVQPFRHTSAGPISVLRVVDEASRIYLTPPVPGAGLGWERLSPVYLSGLEFAPTTHPSRGRLAATGTHMLVWHPVTQEYIMGDDVGDYRGVSFGPDGTTVTSIEYHAHALCVWNVKPRSVLFRTDLKGIDTFDNGSVAMMPDGERVILAAGNVLRCVPIHGGSGWDTATKKPPLEIALHPSGGTLLVADGSKKVTAYDTSNGKAAAQYDWGIGKVGCVTYSSDGTLAAAGGEKGQVVVWDAE